MKEYDRFEKGAANSNTSTKILQKQMEDDNARIIITTIQKLDKFISKNKEHEVYKKHIVMILMNVTVLSLEICTSRLQSTLRIIIFLGLRARRFFHRILTVPMHRICALRHRFSEVNRTKAGTK